MSRQPRTLKVRTEDGEDVTVLGAPPQRFGDVYHAFLHASWPAALAGVVATFLVINAAFALVYLAGGGVHGVRPRSFFDAYAFSIQTMATIGYGEMHPVSAFAHVVVMAESVAGLLVTAVVTGLVFAKFSQPASRIVFSSRVAFGPMNGVPTLSFRVGNERSNLILEATVRVVMVRTERTLEGTTLYRMYDLPLVRERSTAMTRSWNAMHVVTPGSFFDGATPESLKRDEVELIVSVVGTDDTSLQSVHARKRYLDSDIAWGTRLADVITSAGEGGFVVDLRRFHDHEPTVPTEAFPYPRPPSPGA